MSAEYIRQRAARLRAAAAVATNEDVRSDYASGARHLEIVADEIDHEFHITDEDE